MVQLLVGKKSIDKDITELPIISERFCGVKYVDKRTDISVILYTIYLPTSSQDEEFLEIISLLSFDIDQNNTDNSVIILGTDSNVSSKSSKRRLESMKNFLSIFSMSTILTNDQPTFHHNNQTSVSQIDHIYFFVPEQSDVNVRLKKHLCLKDDPSNISSHDVLVGEVVLPVVREHAESEDYSSSYTPFLVKKPKWNESGLEGYQNQSARILGGLCAKYEKVEYLPTLCEMFSRALVISAEKHFETTKPSQKKKKTEDLPHFSREYRDAHKNHKAVFAKWRKAGRPSDTLNPAKKAVFESRRNLQKIARDEESAKSMLLHDDLMDTFKNDINKVCAKLKKARGDAHKQTEIPFIETLAGTFTGNNVLEGFRCNTENLCNEDEKIENKYDNDIYDMFVKDSMIIFDITLDV